MARDMSILVMGVLLASLTFALSQSVFFQATIVPNIFLAYPTFEARAANDTAEAIENVLHRCGLTRYLFLGTRPLEPQFFEEDRMVPETFLFSFPFFFSYTSTFKSFQAAVSRTNFIVFRTSEVRDMTSRMRRYLEEHFAETPWYCARDLHPSQPFRFLYRYQ
ncbi:hypothetical protein COU77_00660 [Candidatus Peregrinibacteria bacterium CG10_big_fil_rev_8_21_14_0_10_49_16]|nr:MAG: hypothetical protein COW95_04605 [Candidatus Peregrinibacteria bacterium CG22_combo_CG10-13_8_21_14_all_49_11]PIR52375.1 MAG: hypothetical protein COU77_00660 [Candidatus Peregrinibacteria bacterium CG10_big_fil_rev_8_21_14_0_10_49_16]